MTETRSGGCLCGAVTYSEWRFNGAHCEIADGVPCAGGPDPDLTTQVPRS